MTGGKDHGSTKGKNVQTKEKNAQGALEIERAFAYRMPAVPPAKAGASGMQNLRLL
jgi:hypothetical protein